MISLESVCSFRACAGSNQAFSGLPKNTINQLQLFQNSQVLTLCVKSLHWLPVSFCIIYWVVLLVYRALHELVTDCISEMLFDCGPGGSLRSTDSTLLAVPHTKMLGIAAFSHYTAKLWNNLPEDLRGAGNSDLFKHNLKTSLVSPAFMLWKVLWFIVLLLFITILLPVFVIIYCFHWLFLSLMFDLVSSI